jgi:hypothetical protein
MIRIVVDANHSDRYSDLHQNDSDAQHYISHSFRFHVCYGLLKKKCKDIVRNRCPILKNYERTFNIRYISRISKNNR